MVEVRRPSARRPARRWRVLPVLAVAVAMCVAGCSSTSNSPQRQAGGQETPHIDAVIAAIKKTEERTGSDSLRSTAWDFSTDNTLPGLATSDPAWIVQTHDCWGKSRCENGKSASLVATIREIVASGQTIVDVSGMTGFPSGGFRQALIDGTAQGAKSGYAPTIRLLFGETPLFDVGDKKLTALQQEVQAANPKATVVATSWSALPVLNGFTWNHSKIVAADGRRAFVSGINMWTESYLQSRNPVTDVGVHVDGSAALDAQKFLDAQWRFVCTNQNSRVKYVITVVPNKPNGGCPGTRAPEASPGTGDVPVLALGRLAYISDGKTFGRIDDPGVSAADQRANRCLVPNISNAHNNDAAYQGRNVADEAQAALIASARSSIVIGQQDMVFRCLPNNTTFVRLYDEIARKLQQGVKTTIVVSGRGSQVKEKTSHTDPESSYSIPIPTAKIQEILIARVAKQMPAQQAKATVCRNLTLAELQVNGEGGWPGQTGGYRIPALHSKLVLVDDEAFYIGSQNLYPSHQPEFGYIIDDRRAANQLIEQFVDPMTKWSVKKPVPCG